MTTTPTVGDEVTFSPFLTDFAPQVAALKDGTFDIVWSRSGGDIAGRHFNETGNFTGGDFLSVLSSSDAKALSKPEVFQQADGRVVVQYQELFGPGDDDIRWHNPDEVHPNSNSNASEFTFDDETLLDSTAVAGGGGANAFFFTDQGHTNLALRFTDENGNAFGDRIFVGAHDGQVQQNPALAGLHTAAVAVAYENFDNTSFARDVRLHIYGRNGSDISGEVPLSATNKNAAFPDATVLHDGSLLVTWQESDGMAFRHVSSTGASLDLQPTVIPSSAGFLPKVTALNDGGFLIAWTAGSGTEQDGSVDLDIFAQRFDASGNAVGHQIHIDEAGDQGLFNLSLTTLADGRVVLAYGSETGNSTNVTTLDYRIIDPRDGVIVGTQGNDNIVGREDGSDISGLGGNDKLTGRDAIDVLDGGNGNDHLLGFGANDQLFGGSGNDNLEGGAGNDVLDGGAGNDVLSGGPGSDTASYAHASAAVAVSLALTSAQNTHGAGIDTLSGIENLTGSGFNDQLTGSSGINTLDGGLGNDVLSGGAGNDFLIGGHGRDELTGGTGADDFFLPTPRAAARRRPRAT